MNNEYYGAPSTPTSDFLAHYGVLGMKWGIRRAAKKGTTYSYQSHATKKYKKAAAKLLAKAEKASAGGKNEKSTKLKAKSAVMANRAKRSAEVDKGEEEYARGLSTKKALGVGLLVPGGSTVMKAYAQQRAMSKQSGKHASGKKVQAGIESAITGTIGSRMRKAAYIRQGENRKTIGAKLHNQLEKSRDAFADYVEPATTAYNKNRKKKCS